MHGNDMLQLWLYVNVSDVMHVAVFGETLECHNDITWTCCCDFGTHGASLSPSTNPWAEEDDICH
jgi:hypothetical protein